MSGIGDLTSDEKGTGARFNTGKVPFELIAWKPFAMSLHAGSNEARRNVRAALMSLGEFQCDDRDDAALKDILIYSAAAAGITIPQLYAETAWVLDYGKRKYDEWNWAKGMPWDSVIGCLARHLLGTPEHEGMWDDPTGFDRDSGRMHVGHVGCNVMFLQQFMLTWREGDNRPKRLVQLPF